MKPNFNFTLFSSFRGVKPIVITNDDASSSVSSLFNPHEIGNSIKNTIGTKITKSGCIL